MSQTDPIAELLTRIRNAMHARYNQVEVPHSRMREAICRTLSAEREPVIRGIQRVSRPSLRRYAGANSMPRVPHGMGVQVVTTPLGVMTDREARRKKVGGEVLLRIW